MHHAVVIDDDINILEKIKTEFDEMEDFEVRYFLSTSAITSSILEKADILFIDIELKGENGMLYAKGISATYPDLALVFMTSHENYVFDTYLLKTLFFIRKSNFQEDFRNSIKKWYSMYSLTKNGITIKIGHDVRYLKASEIVFCEKKDNKLIIYRDKNGSLETYDTIRNVMHQSPENLYLINKGVLINLDYVDTYDSAYVYLKGNIKFEISRRKRKEFKDALFSYKRYVY